MSERYLLGQTFAMGEAMRNYPAFGLPGIDILTDNREFTTAKQAQSIARQYGKPGVLSELYGVCDYDFDFRGFKLQGDWLAALGVTTRVHHLTWVSMSGEAKRDYPPSIGYQSPWHKEYGLIEDYFSRLNVCLTRGKAVCKIGVIHPIESFWLIFGPDSQTGGLRKQMEDDFQNLAEWLIYAQLDFDYISEVAFPENHLYDYILVPGCFSLRSTTVDKLKTFVKRGGKLIVAGRVPEYVDAKPSKMLANLEYNVVQYNRAEIVAALEPARTVGIINVKTALLADKLIYQLREDVDCFWLFICNGDKPKNPDVPTVIDAEIRVSGCFEPIEYDAVAGGAVPIPYMHRNGQTLIPRMFWPHDSVLLRLMPTDAEISVEPRRQAPRQMRRIITPSEVPVILTEPNVLVLDYAEFSTDGLTFEPRMEILKIDSSLRQRLGLEKRDGMLCQPYAVMDSPPQNITLRYVFHSNVAVSGAKLALERAFECTVNLNGGDVPSISDGYYVDEDIHTVKLTDIRRGENILIITVPISNRHGLENVYILGDFGVTVRGAKVEITDSVSSLAFGDIAHQGLPFYGGNVVYHFVAETDDCLQITASHFRNPLLSVDVDGRRVGAIAFAPYTLCADVGRGTHKIDITAYGNRYNTFGSIHNADQTYYFPGNPAAWRTTGCAWSDEYRLKPTGILSSPILETEAHQ
jgi:hypothetical protein